MASYLFLYLGLIIVSSVRESRQLLQNGNLMFDQSDCCFHLFQHDWTKLAQAGRPCSLCAVFLFCFLDTFLISLSRWWTCLFWVLSQSWKASITQRNQSASLSCQNMHAHQVRCTTLRAHMHTCAYELTRRALTYAHAHAHAHTVRITDFACIHILNLCPPAPLFIFVFNSSFLLSLCVLLPLSHPFHPFCLSARSSSSQRTQYLQNSEERMSQSGWHSQTSRQKVL